MAKLRLRGLLALAAGILITIGGCAEQSPTITSGPEAGTLYQLLEVRSLPADPSYSSSTTPRVEQVIGPEGGTLSIPGGHSIAFPAGALSAPTRIRAKVDSRYIQVDLEPHGIQFPAGYEPELKLSYAAAQSVPSRLTVIYLDDAGRVLEDMSGTNDATNKLVSARLPHFSRYALVGAN